jgi:hypothetical protein
LQVLAAQWLWILTDASTTNSIFQGHNSRVLNCAQTILVGKTSGFTTMAAAKTLTILVSQHPLLRPNERTAH